MQVLGSMAVGAVFAMLQSWDFSAFGCVFPPFALIPQPGSSHSVSNPSVFLDCLFIFSGLGSIKVVSVFLHGQPLYALRGIHFCLPELGEHHVLQDLIQFLAIGWLPCPQLLPLWVWVVVLPHLFSSVSELLEFFSFGP